MDMVNFLAQDGIVANLKASSKKQALQELSQQAAVLTGLHERAIFDVLLQREKLGTTGIGRGVAIPHGKMQEVKRLHGIFARLPKPIDFDAIDEQPVDLIFLLLAPESAGADHLKALARISRLLRDDAICAKLRGADDPEALFALLTVPAVVPAV
jgi:PTS system nitrogen regulatory IIA component